jgi:hypothetical protein
MHKIFTLCFLSLLISFTQASAGTIYWVGTTGNYSDGANWNTQSNGSGTSGAPVNTDDIVIDRNATITIDGTFSPFFCLDHQQCSGEFYQFSSFFYLYNWRKYNCFSCF